MQLTKEDVSAALIRHPAYLEARIFEPPEYWQPAASNKECADMLALYQITDAVAKYAIPVWYDPKLHRLVFGLLWRDQFFGAVGRALNKSHLPKWYVYNRSEGAPFCAPTAQVFSTLILVEDAISACKASYVTNAMALLGTELSRGSIKQMLGSWNKIIIALDRDATRRSLDMQKTLLQFVPNVCIARLDNDLKYCSVDVIKGLL